MSIARAFTTKRSAKPPQISAPLPQRALTTKQTLSSGTIRHKISAPVELISTTNMLSYNAPDLYPTSDSPPPLTFSSSSSSRSVSDSSDEALSVSSPPTSPDSSTAGDFTADSPTQNHLSCYFNSRVSTSSNESAVDPSAPTIPTRSPSHTKRTHEMLHHKKSISRISTRSKNSMTNFARDSLQMFAPTPEVEEVKTFNYATQFEEQQQLSVTSLPKTRQKSPSVTSQSHPFGAELAQVSELAEEFGQSLQEVRVVDPEEIDLLNRGFFKFGAQDYLSEIADLYATAFDEPSSTSMLWI